MEQLATKYALHALFMALTPDQRIAACGVLRNCVLDERTEHKQAATEALDILRGDALK